MTHNTEPPHDYDELISLHEAAEYAGLSVESIRTYANHGRFKAKKIGNMWVTSRRWVDEYLSSRDTRGRKPRSQGGT